MILENDKCCVEITIDESYKLDSADNSYYDAVFNPHNYSKDYMATTFSVHIKLADREFSIALIGHCLSHIRDSILLEDEILTVLQGNIVTQIRVTDGTIVRCTDIDGWGCTFAIYRVPKGYVVYGEMEITMLDLDLNKLWERLGADIFVSITREQSFEIRDNLICVYDFGDRYYEIDFDGKLVRCISNSK